ncbi:MAG: hypothetical protein ACI82A_001616 [Candidatus Azotimanducaceae bacterium]|jgi:hypothetical protein
MFRIEGSRSDVSIAEGSFSIVAIEIRGIVPASENTHSQPMLLFRYYWFGRLSSQPQYPFRVGIGLMIMLVAIYYVGGHLTPLERALYNLIEAVNYGLMAWFLLYFGYLVEHAIRTSDLTVPEEWLQRLSPPRWLVYAETLLAFGLGSWSVAYVILLDDGSRGAEDLIAFSVQMLVFGVLIVHLLSVVIRHTIWLWRLIGQGLSINVFALEDLPVLTQGLILWIIFLCISISTYTIPLPIAAEGRAFFLANQIANYLLMGVAIILFMLIPVFRLRNRIVAAKQAESRRVQSGLRGRLVASGDLALPCQAETYSSGDLLAYLSYLDSSWDWPFRQRVGTIILYVLVPPIAWILSALVEMLVSASVATG